MVNADRQARICASQFAQRANVPRRAVRITSLRRMGNGRARVGLRFRNQRAVCVITRRYRVVSLRPRRG